MALNVVAPETVTIKELAEAIVARHPTEVSFGPPRSGDVPPALVSAEKASAILGWTTEVPFESGLDELISSATTQHS
jgi:nucleoside-diphosphate-sugar epimerase